MQLEELIKNFQKVKETYGNINVRICDAEDRPHDIDGYDVLDERKPKEEYKDSVYAQYLYYGDDYTEKTGQKEMVLWCFP